jgi:hypothetical protein
MAKAEAAQGARATTGLTPLFSRFWPQLIFCRKICDRISANSMIPMRSRGGGYLRKPQNPQTGPSPSLPRFASSQELFRAPIHGFARIERAMLSAAFNLDFIDCGNVRFPFPSRSKVPRGITLFRIFSGVRAARLAAGDFNYEAHATCPLGAGNRWRVLLLHHLAFQRKPSRRLAHSLGKPREGGDHGSGERRIS